MEPGPYRRPNTLCLLVLSSRPLFRIKPDLQFNKCFYISNLIRFSQYNWELVRTSIINTIKGMNGERFTLHIALSLKAYMGSY